MKATLPGQFSHLHTHTHTHTHIHLLYIPHLEIPNWNPYFKAQIYFEFVLFQTWTASSPVLTKLLEKSKLNSNNYNTSVNTQGKKLYGYITLAFHLKFRDLSPFYCVFNTLSSTKIPILFGVTVADMSKPMRSTQNKYGNTFRVSRRNISCSCAKTDFCCQREVLCSSFSKGLTTCLRLHHLHHANWYQPFINLPVRPQGGQTL